MLVARLWYRSLVHSTPKEASNLLLLPPATMSPVGMEEFPAGWLATVESDLASVRLDTESHFLESKNRAILNGMASSDVMSTEGAQSMK